MNSKHQELDHYWAMARVMSDFLDSHPNFMKDWYVIYTAHSYMDPKELVGSTPITRPKPPADLDTQRILRSIFSMPVAPNTNPGLTRSS